MGDDLADLHLGALGDEDFERAGGFGKDLRGDLIGLDLEQGIAGGDGIPVFFLPASDHARGDRFADRGDFYRDEIRSGGAHEAFRLGLRLRLRDETLESLALADLFLAAAVFFAEALRTSERGPAEGGVGLKEKAEARS